MARDCTRRLVEASKNENGIATLSEREVDDLLKTIIEQARLKSTIDGSDLDNNIIEEISEIKLRAKLESNIQKRNAAINLIKRKELTNKIEGFIASGLSPKKAIQAILVGVQGLYNGGRLSIDAKYKVTSSHYLGSLTKSLEKEGLLPLLRENGIWEQVEKELFSLQSGEISTKSIPEVMKAARIIQQHQEAIRQRLNKAGARIDKLEGFTIAQSHDRVEMRKAGFEKWKNDVLPLIDKERTFGQTNPEEFLASIFEVLTTGVSKRAQESEKLFELKGYANLAKKLSKSRVLHFKDAESSITYRNTYGKGNFIEGLITGIDTASRNIALMETLGTNPRAMFDTILQETKERYRNQPDKIKGLINDRALQNFYNEVDGSTMIPENPTGAQISSALRAGQTLSKLGGVLLSSITDIPFKALELQYQGFGILDSYARSIRDIRLNDIERKQFGLSLGIGLDGMIGSIVSRFSATDDLPGTLSKLQRLFFKLNGLEWWTNAQKLGTSMAMSNRLAQLKNTSFNKLDKATKRVFSLYDIQERDWNIIRRSTAKQIDGNEYITPDNITAKTGENIEAIQQAENKLRAYFIDRADMATITPGAREQAILHQGLKRGTIEGELFRFFTQFKSFPVTIISKIYGRILYGKGKADIPALLQTVIMTTVFGYLAMVGKDLSKGRTPRNPKDSATLAAAFTQGGGAGILGDFFMGEYDRFGRDLTTTLAGPSFSSANDLAKIWTAAKNGDDTAAKSVKFLTDSAPFTNLFYIRPALNYMFLYQVQEQLNPGYLRRMERRIERENNQKFLIKPSETIK